MAVIQVSPLNSNTALRNLIQSVQSIDNIRLTNAAGTTAVNYSVTTLAKIACIPGSVYQSGYIIEGVNQNRSILTNTRIYQEVVDANGPSEVREVKFVYSGANNGPILRATTGSYTLHSVMIMGTHAGWAGNGGVYMSLTTSFGNKPINANLTLRNSDIQLNAGSQTNGTSSFLQSWNNLGNVTIENTLFEESAFTRGSFHFASMNGNLGNLGIYVVTGSTFVGNDNFKSNSNRLESVDATLTGNTFQQGSYLDLAGNLNGITIDTNVFKTIYGDTTVAPYAGSGIRFTRLSSSTATLSGSATILGNNFDGWGLAISNNDSVPGSGGSIITTGSNIVTLGMTGDPSAITDTFARLSAGGIAADTINYSASTNKEWISGGAGADNITGGTESDFIIGGVGADTIATGTGSDTIVYYATNEKGDTITDFATGTDSLAFRGNAPGGVGFFDFAPGYTLIPGTNFITSGGPTNAVPTFIFTGGVLSYDADGTDGGLAENIATFSSGTVNASDIKFF